MLLFFKVEARKIITELLGLGDELVALFVLALELGIVFGEFFNFRAQPDELRPVAHPDSPFLGFGAHDSRASLLRVSLCHRRLLTCKRKAEERSGQQKRQTSYSCSSPTIAQKKKKRRNAQRFCAHCIKKTQGRQSTRNMRPILSPATNRALRRVG